MQTELLKACTLISFIRLITTLATRLQWALHIISIWEKSSPLFPNSPLTCADWPVDLPSFLHSVKSRHIIYACNQSDVIIPIVATLVRILLFLQVSSLALPRLLCTHLIHPSRDKQIIWAKQLAHRWKHRVYKERTRGLSYPSLDHLSILQFNIS